MVRAALVLALSLAAGACELLPTRVETVFVKVPVEIARTPPPELLTCTASLTAPKFVERTDPAASSCLTQAGERALTGFVDRTLTCHEGWRAWAVEPAPEKKP